MDHKKIGLSPEDLKKLKALLKEEEANVDVMSDDELLEAEKALEKSIHKLSGKGSTKDPKVDEAMDHTWQRIQKSMNPSGTGNNQDEASKVIEFRKARKAMPWTTISVLAMAALALLVLYPSLQKSQSEMGDPAQMGTKGAGDGTHAWQADCDIDVLGIDEVAVEEAGIGNGYEVENGKDFRISVKCSKAGFVQVWSQTPQGEEVRNSAIEANQRAFIIEDGKVSVFNLAKKADMTLEIAVTEKEIKPEINLFEIGSLPTSFGDVKVLWTDSVKFREKK